MYKLIGFFLEATMIDHSSVWQLKIAIGNRITSGTMTVAHLEAFVKMPKAELDRIFAFSEKVLPEAIQGVL